MSASLTRRLLRYRLRAARRRLSGGLGLLVIAIAIAGLAALFLLGRSLAAAGADEPVVRDYVFWLGTLAALIYSYTSFEVIFRAPDARLLGALPLAGRHRFDDLFVRALFVHLPLALPSVAYAIALMLSEHPNAIGAGLFALVVGLTQFVVGLCLAIMLHLYAGRSLLSQGSEIRKLLAGMSVPDDAALLVYAPALGLFGTLVLGIFIDLAFRDAFFRDKATLLGPVLAVALGVAVFAVVRARKIADESLHLILPRFSEVDVPPPYREDGVAKATPGERFQRLVPTGSRPYFMRDLKQLRRRFRLDRVLLWVFAAVAFKVAHDVPDARSPLGAMVLALALFDGVFIVSAFRLRGELASRSLDLTLPKDAAAERLGRLAATAHHPLVAWVIAVVMTATADVQAGAWMLLVGLPLTVALTALAHGVAWLGRARPALAATLWRVALVSFITVLGGVV